MVHSDHTTLMQRTLIALIRAYQRTLSPDHGWFRHNHPYGFCKFYPTCSEYAVDAIRARGVARGSFAALFRVVRCTPWAQRRFDPIN